MSQNKKTSW